jgi:hypothetical protein
MLLAIANAADIWISSYMSKSVEVRLDLKGAIGQNAR